MITFKTLRAIIVGLLLISVLAACGGTATTGEGTASEAAAEVSAAASAATGGASAEPSEEAEASAEPSEEAEASAEGSPEGEASAEGSAEAGASAEASGTAEAVTLPEVDPATVEGDIVTSGSSTVFPLTQRMAERFQEEGYTGTVSVDEIGSGAGFERFCVAAETDIANASRAIEEDEVQACEENNRTPIEFRVGTDALTVAVSQQNDFLTDISKDDLQRIFTGEITTWDQLDPSYPAEAIQIFAPGTDSGTYDFFNEVILDDDEAKIEAFQGLNPSQSENDNVLVQGIEASPNAIGYFGFAYYQQNEDRLKAISIDGVEPNEETAENGEYILARPLFIYSDAGIMQEKPQVAAFINFYLTYVDDEILDVGYFPASDEALNKARQKWLDAVGE